MLSCKNSRLFPSKFLKTVISNFVVGRGDVLGTHMGTHMGTLHGKTKNLFKILKLHVKT